MHSCILQSVQSRSFMHFLKRNNFIIALIYASNVRKQINEPFRLKVSKFCPQYRNFFDTCFLIKVECIHLKKVCYNISITCFSKLINMTYFNLNAISFLLEILNHRMHSTDRTNILVK